MIIKYVFLPYLCYLFAFIILASDVAGDYLRKLRDTAEALEKEHKDEISEGTYKVPANYDDWEGIALSVSLSVFCFYMLYVTSKQEIKSLWANPKFCFTDFRNWIDLSIFFLANIFLIKLNRSVFFGRTYGERVIYGIYSIRTYGALCCWFMWI